VSSLTPSGGVRLVMGGLSQPIVRVT
jgi:hypothetical protein